MLRSLPHDTLRLYLLVEEDLGPTTGLNVASPLDQGIKEECIAALALLRNSADLVVRECYPARILGSKEFQTNDSWQSYSAVPTRAAGKNINQASWRECHYSPFALYIPDAHWHTTKRRHKVSRHLSNSSKICIHWKLRVIGTYIIIAVTLMLGFFQQLCWRVGKHNLTVLDHVIF